MPPQCISLWSTETFLLYDIVDAHCYVIQWQVVSELAIAGETTCLLRTFWSTDVHQLYTHFTNQE